MSITNRKNKKLLIIFLIALIILLISSTILFLKNTYADVDTWACLTEGSLLKNRIINLRDGDYNILEFGGNETINDGTVTETDKKYFDDVIITYDRAINRKQQFLALTRIMLCKKFITKYGQTISFIAAREDTEDAGGEVITNGKNFYMSIHEFDANGNIVSDGKWTKISEEYTIGQSDSYWSNNRWNVSYIIPTFRWDNGDTANGAGADSDNFINPFQVYSKFDIFDILTSPFNYTFDLNGGNVNGSTDYLTIQRTGATTVEGPATPTREGYTFQGWKITSVGGKQKNKIYSASELRTMFSDSKYYSSLFEDATFEAQWQLNTYHFEYYGNGAQFGSVPSDLITYNTRYKIRENGFDRIGYTFAGYSVVRNSDMKAFCKPSMSWVNVYDTTENDWKIYQPGENHRIDSSWVYDGQNDDTYTFRAKWVKNQYNLTFDANGGKFTDSAKSDTTVSDDYNTSTALVTYLEPDYCLREGGLPIKSGAKFLGFYTEKQGGDQIYSEDGWCTNDGLFWTDYKWTYTDHVTLYAHWEDMSSDIKLNHYVMDEYGVYPDAPTRSDIINLPNKIMPVNQLADDNLLVMNGILFDHAILENNIVIEFSPNGGETIDLYYKRVKHKVIFNSSYNGGHWQDTGTDDFIQEFYYGANVSLDHISALKNNWDFIGWNTDQNAKVGLGSFVMGNDDITIYALYSKEIVATFIDLLGTRTLSSTIFNKDCSWTLQMLSISNDDQGYEIIGWNTHKNIEDTNATKSEVAQESLISIDDNITYYAVYFKNVTLRYELDGGKETKATEQVTANVYINGDDSNHILGKELKLPLCEKEDYDDGSGVIHQYHLDAWGENSISGVQYKSSQSYVLKADTVMYAVWKEGTADITYTVKYNANGVNVTDVPDSVTVNYSEYFQISPKEPTRMGMRFVNWNTEPEGGGIAYETGQEVSRLTTSDGGVVELFAQWESKKFKIVKASATRNETIIKRTPGDDDWYHTDGKLTLKELLAYPIDKCVQVWNINESGEIKRLN